MAHYNFKELRDALPPEMVAKWMEEDGSADYDSTLWSLGAEYIKQLKKERDEARNLAEEEIKRIKEALRDHIAWSVRELGQQAAQDLLDRLYPPSYSSANAQDQA